MSKWWLVVLLLGCTARAQAQGLSVRAVVSEARGHNPTLKAAMLQYERAHWEVLGAEAKYEPVLALNSSLSQQATSNVFGGAVRINTVKRADVGGTLSKRLIWGTDLSLTLGTYVQESKFSGGLGLAPGTGTGAGMGTGIPGVFAAFGTFGPVYGLTAKLELKQPLWKGRGREVGEASLREARASEQQGRYGGDRAASELLRDVLTAYWELWYADAALAIQRQSRDVAARQRDEADARTRSGSLAPAEVLTFETQVASSDEAVLSALTERESRVHALARLVGADQALSIDALSDEPLGGHVYVRASVEEQALRQSPEVRERFAALALARVQQQTADDPQKPQLDLNTWIQTQGLGLENAGDTARQFVSGDVISGFVGLTYQAPLRDRVRRATAAKARLATQVADEQLRETRLRVLAEARSALDREAAGEQKVALAERTVSIAERQLAAQQARYQSGSATSIAVLESQDALRAAKLRLARARADWAESALLLDHLTGTLLAHYTP